jgi:hypothetical protein
VELLSLRPLGSGNEYELKARVTPASAQAGVGELKLFINGVEVQGRGEAPLGGGLVTQRLPLAPGTQTVGLRAARRDGKVLSDLVTAAPVQVKAIGAAQPVLRVLAVGISTYDDASFSTGVKFAALDAEELTRSLRAGAPGLYRDVDATVLTGRKKTDLKTIDAELKALVQRAKPEDVVVIYLAGHGKAPEGKYHFIPADFIYDGPQAFNGQRTLSHERLESLLKGLGAGKRLLILDTCASGATIEGRDGDTEQKDALSILMHSTGRHILAAASPQGKALELGAKGHGVYTYALLEGLAGAADPGRQEIEVDALAKYLSRRVPELTRQIAGYAQQPMRSAIRDSFPLVRRVAGP